MSRYNGFRAQLQRDTSSCTTSAPCGMLLVSGRLGWYATPSSLAGRVRGHPIFDPEWRADLSCNSWINDYPSDRGYQRRTAFFGVRFRPGMAAAFLPEAPQLNDRIEPLENVLGSDARHLSDQLAAASSPIAMARLMDTVLRPLKPPDTAQNALHELSMGAGTIEQVASAAALSTRQLRRLCMERAGVSPKYLRRILRFRKAVQRITEVGTDSSRSNWADFAAMCGYYDQAHFIREFQEFAGHTPGRYLQSLP